MPAKHDVYIVPFGTEYRVRPSVAAVDKAQKLKIRNLTDQTIWLAFPPGLITDGDVQNLPPHQSNSAKPFTFSAAADGSYGYSVFAVVGGKPVMAMGESDPILIVD